MLTTDQLTAIRERCEEDLSHPERLDIGSFIAHAREDIPALLNDLDEMTADRDHCKRMTFETVIKKGIQIELDRDRWKARCEAMERAIQQEGTSSDTHECFSCSVCKHNYNSEPCRKCTAGVDFSFVFDEARFAGSVNHDS